MAGSNTHVFDDFKANMGARQDKAKISEIEKKLRSLPPAPKAK